jgi:DNA-binding transcriptional LysR family regulator
MPDLSLLRHFVAVAETGSFTRASAKLNISQSSISRSISRLEDDLGVVLLERSTRKLHLTEAGQALLDGTAVNLDRLAVAVSDARRIGRGAQARLRIGICTSIMSEAQIIRRGLMAFRQAWPHVELTITSLLSFDQPAALRAAQIDVGFMQLDNSDHDDLAWRTLSRNTLKVVVPTAWGYNAERLNLEDLGHRPWLLPDPESANTAYERALDLFRAAGFKPIVAGYVDHALTAEIMLACGLGATLAHSYGATQTLDCYALIPLDIKGESHHFETVVSWAATSKSEQLTGLVACVEQAIAQG